MTAGALAASQANSHFFRGVLHDEDSGRAASRCECCTTGTAQTLLTRAAPSATAASANIRRMSSDSEAVTAVLGALVGIIGAGSVQFGITRRSERAETRGIAHLVKLELLTIEKRLLQATEDGRLWDPSYPLSSPSWETHRGRIAAELTEGELTTLHSTFDFIGAANAWAERAGAGRSRRSRAYTSAEDFRILIELIYLASASLDMVANRRGGLIRARRDRLALAPSPMAPCTCGHTWSDHGWTVRRRRLRTTHLTVTYAERPCPCRCCACKRFVYAADRLIAVRWLRRIQLLAPAPYEPAWRPFRRQPRE